MGKGSAKMQKINNIDGGNPFDFGKTSQDYAKYRDIYPDIFYQKIMNRGLCKDGQTVLDIGTGTGVLPRNMYRFGAKWIGTDISDNQIEQAILLADSEKMSIDFYTCPAEKIEYPDHTFDVITACQCIWYPDHKVLAPKFANILKKRGKFLILYMAWLPFDDKIAGRSEDIILKYNPKWNGAGEIRKPVWVPEEYLEFFDITYREEYDVLISFTRESWHGRMRACRGVGASLTIDDFKAWDKEHMQMLKKEAPSEFEILHYVSIAELTVK